MDNPGEEKELDKLRKTIEEFRAKAERNANVISESKSANSTPQSDMCYPVSESGPWSHPSSFSAPAVSSGRHYDALSPNSTINKRVSSGSISSMSSHASHSSVSSASSSSSANSDQKQYKKKRWLPLKSAFSRGNRSSQSSGVNEFEDFDDSGCMLSPTSARKVFHKTSLNSLDGAVSQASYMEMLQIVQEKDRKLTDVRLEALTSQHQLHQLQDQIAQMQHEMALLRMENERLQAGNATFVPKDTNTPNLKLNLSPLSSFLPPIGTSDVRPLDVVTSSTFASALSSLDCCKLHRLVSPGSEEDGTQMQFVVNSPISSALPSQHRLLEKVLIGSVPVSRKATWIELDTITTDILLEYCKCIDGESRLGINTASISFYKVGEQTRVPGSTPPDLLPCAFIVGNVDKVEICLKDASCSSVDLMSFRSLISKDILLHYVNNLLQKKRIILHGPSGTGKTSLAYSLANHLLLREKKQFSKVGSVYVYDVKQKGEEELKMYLKSVATTCTEAERNSNPHVIIVENCYMLTSLSETFAPLMKNDANYPYVIGTMLQGKGQANYELCKDFAWISCANNSPHVADYLAKYLRRCLVENEIKGHDGNDEDEYENMLRVITWLPLCWHHVNRCLEGQCASDVTIGPRIFTSCPSEFYASCSWFVQVWNHVIAPYVIAAIRRIRQSQNSNKQIDVKKWVDPTEWVVESFPWNASDMGCDNTLRLKRITSDDLDCPPVPPRLDAGLQKNTKDSRQLPSHSIPINNPNTKSNVSNSCDQDTLRSKNVSTIKRQNSRKYHTESRRDPPVPPMELIGTRDSKNATTVWHRHNSPMTSPTKSTIHASGNRKMH